MVEPIRKISKQGLPLAIFSFTTTENLGFSGSDFFVSREGAVYQAIWKPGGAEIFLLEYSKDGAVKKKTKVDSPPIFPYYLGVFPTGEFILAGLRRREKAKEGEELPPRKPFTGLFKSDGTLIKELSLKDDDRIYDAGAQHEDGFVPAGRNREAAFTLASVLEGQDGNLYFWRRTSPTIMYALSPAGDGVKRYEIDIHKTGLFPASIQAHEGQLAVLFKNAGPGDGIIAVAEIDTGRVLQAYHVDPNAGAAFACYGPGFIFLGTRENKLQLLQFEPN